MSYLVVYLLSVTHIGNTVSQELFWSLKQSKYTQKKYWGHVSPICICYFYLLINYIPTLLIIILHASEDIYKIQILQGSDKKCK